MGNELQVMGLNIAICDDEEIIREQIKELTEKEKSGLCMELYETGDALLASGKQFDIVFLDIQMEGTDGIETAKRLMQHSALKGAEDTILIFITGIREYVFEAFDVAAFHYLLKPIEEEKFREVFHRAERELEKRKSKRRETVFIKTRNRSFSLEKDSILYIESSGKKVEIHTTGETIEAYASMNEMEGQLSCMVSTSIRIWRLCRRSGRKRSCWRTRSRRCRVLWWRWNICMTESARSSMI